MKRVGILAVTILLVLATAAIAETVRQRQQRETVERYLEAKLRDVNRKLDSVKIRSGSALDEHSQKELERAGEELSRKQELLSRKQAEMKSASVETWDRLKAEVNAAIDDLNRSYEKISSLLKKK